MRILFALTSCLALLACARATPAPLRVDGLVAATFTPFKDDAARTFNPDMIASYVEWLNSTGVGYVFVSGTTGESVKLTTEERLMQACYTQAYSGNLVIRYIPVRLWILFLF